MENSSDPAILTSVVDLAIRYVDEIEEVAVDSVNILIDQSLNVSLTPSAASKIGGRGGDININYSPVINKSFNEISNRLTEVKCLCGITRRMLQIIKLKVGDMSLVSLPYDEKAIELERVLQATRGNKTEAARRLGVDRNTIYKRLKRFGIDERWRRNENMPEKGGGESEDDV